MFEVPAKTWRDDELPLFNVERRGNNIIYIKLFHNDETNIYQSVLKYIALSRYYLDRTGPVCAICAICAILNPQV